MKRIQRWRWVLALLAAVWLTGTAQAWRPSGWTYWDWPWAYDSGSGDWYWFTASDTQWIYAGPPVNAWSLLPPSGIAHGWSYWNEDWVYDGDNGAWCWRNDSDTQWCVNMRTSQWTLLGQAIASEEYLVVDLSEGPSASSYPVSYLTAVPSGGWSPTYKTTKLVLRKIPKGTFTMGSPADELGHDSTETQHQVTLTSDFYIGVFEVTQRQWELVMGLGNKPSYFNNAMSYQARPVEQVSTYDIRESPENSDDPAVDWPINSAVNANSFMGKLRAKTGLLGFDLPTESQWEYACRAGTTTALNSGYNLMSTGSDPQMDVAGRYWYNGGSGYSQGCEPSEGTAAVGSYPANQWNLYDMHGNVWEWCLDWYDIYSGSVQDPLGAASGSRRVLRGGGWYNSARDCRSANRSYSWPYYRDYSIGFRVARTLP